MTFSSGVVGTMGALALLISLVALAVALSGRRRAMNAAPPSAAAELTPAARRPGPDGSWNQDRPGPAVANAAGQTDHAGGGEPMAKITPAPASDEVAAVIAAAIAACLDEEANRVGAVAVTHVTRYGAAGPVWKAAGRTAVIGAREAMYGKGYRR